jgi:hypothetical protein
MAWRFVKQPNGRYARFSEIVDIFTHMNMRPEDTYNIFRTYSPELIDVKLAGADNEPGRWDEAIEIIETMHGKSKAQRLAKFGTSKAEKWFMI